MAFRQHAILFLAYCLFPAACFSSERLIQPFAPAKKGIVQRMAEPENEGSNSQKNSVLLSSEAEVLSTATSNVSIAAAGAQFGDVVSPRRRKEGENLSILQPPQQMGQELALAEEQKRRNIIAAVLSIGLAVCTYAWQFTHPVSPVQLLYSMQRNSQPMSVIGVNQKPTVVDFWAPWCENCKFMAPTLLQVEDEYKDRVNFIMVDGDKGESWPYIEAFGVDAIPHLALVSADGTVETALIGPVPKRVLRANLDTMLENAAVAETSQQSTKALPFQMYDAFANNPNGRKVRFQ